MKSVYCFSLNELKQIGTKAWWLGGYFKITLNVIKAVVEYIRKYRNTRKENFFKYTIWQSQF